MSDQPRVWVGRYTGDDIVKASDSTLKRKACGLCDQSLYRMKRSPRNCSATYPMPDGTACHWAKLFHPETPDDTAR